MNDPTCLLDWEELQQKQKLERVAESSVGFDVNDAAKLAKQQTKGNFIQ